MLKKINNTNIFRLFLFTLTMIIPSQYILSELSFAKTSDGISGLENNQTDNKILVCEVVQYCSHPKEFQSIPIFNTTLSKIYDTKINKQTALTLKTNKSNTTVLPNITSNISLIITPSPDIINPLQNKDKQVPNVANNASTGNNSSTVITGAKEINSNANITTNATTITATMNQNKIGDNSLASKTVTPSSILQSINSKSNAATTKNTTSENKIPPNNLTTNKANQVANNSSQKTNNNNLINKSTIPQSNKVGQLQQTKQPPSSSPFPWLDQLLKTLGIKK